MQTRDFCGQCCVRVTNMPHDDAIIFSARGQLHACESRIARATSDLRGTRCHISAHVCRLQDESLRLASGVLREGYAMPTIALVDDDRNILTSVSIALEAEGYRTMTYTDGASA